MSDDDEVDDDGPTGTLYITAEGLAKLTDELTQLLKVERPKVVAVVTWAASLGDRSENADYQYGKKRLREIDRRMSWLDKRIQKLTVVDPAAQKDKSRIYFGATVTLLNEDGESKVTYTLVGSDETDLARGRISVDSPVGRALLRKQVDDVVSVRRPKGETEFTVVHISYD